MKKRFSNIWSFILSYKYIITILVFAIWILFLDQTNLLYRSKLLKEIDFLEKRNDYYEAEIEKNETYYQDLLNNPKAKERLAREEYFMKKDNEEIFIIDDQTIK